MAFEMTPSRYLSNPMGKGSAVVPNGQIKENLNTQFENLYQYMKGFCYFLGKDSIVYHVKIPSGKEKTVEYDVVILFSKSAIENRRLDRIDDIPFACFSNCPSFMFTYANTFYQKDMIIPWCKKLYNEAIRTKHADTRNSFDLISYEKSLYFALKYILKGNRNILENFMLTCIKVKKPEEILKNVHSGDEIMQLYNRAKEKAKKEKNKKKEEELESASLNGEESTPKRENRAKKIKKTSSIKSIKKISKVKKK